MDRISFSEQAEPTVIYVESSGFPEHIQKIWEDRNQFEEAVHILLQEHQQNKPRDIFY